MIAFRTIANVATAVCVLVVSAPPAGAQQPVKIDLAAERVGAEPTSFVSVVGVWRIEQEGPKKVLAVDGRQWKEGRCYDENPGDWPGLRRA